MRIEWAALCKEITGTPPLLTITGLGLDEFQVSADVTEVTPHVAVRFADVLEPPIMSHMDISAFDPADQRIDIVRFPVLAATAQTPEEKPLLGSLMGWYSYEVPLRGYGVYRMTLQLAGDMPYEVRFEVAEPSLLTWFDNG